MIELRIPDPPQSRIIPSEAYVIPATEVLPDAFTAGAKRGGGSKAATSLHLAELDSAIKRIAEIKALEKDLKAEKDMLLATAAALIEPKRLELSRTGGKPLGSLKVNGHTWVGRHNWQQSFSEDEIVHLKAEFGPLYPTYFRDFWTISVDATQLSAAVKAELLALGAERKVETRSLKQLESDRVMNETVQSLCQTCGIKPTVYFM